MSMPNRPPRPRRSAARPSRRVRATPTALNNDKCGTGAAPVGPSTTGKTTGIERVLLAAIVVAATVPRFYLLDIWPGISCDVCKVGLLAYRFCTYGELSWNPNIGYIGPVQTVVMAAMRPLFGTSVWTARVPVAVMAVLAVVVIWAAVRPLLGRWTALAAAAIAAGYPWLIMSSRYALEPMWLVFPNAMLLWALCRYLRSGHPAPLIGTCALAGLGLTLHPAQIVVLPGLAVALGWGWVGRSVRFRPLWTLVAFLLFTIMAGPVLPYHWDSLLGRQKVASKKLGIGYQPPMDYLAPAMEIATGRQLYQYFGGAMNPPSAWQTGVDGALLVGLVLGAARFWRRGGLAGRALVAYFVIGVAVGYVFCSGANRLQILGHFRYLICLSLLIPMLWAAGLVSLIERGRWRSVRLVGAVCLGAALAVLPWQLAVYYFGARTRTGGGNAFHHRAYLGDPKQLAADFIRRNRLPPDRTIILAQDYEMYYPLRYFLDDGYHIQTLWSEPFIPLNDHFPFLALANNPQAECVVALYPRSPLGSSIERAFRQSQFLRPEHVVYEVPGPAGPASTILALYRVPPSAARTQWVRQMAARETRIPSVQGSVPPSGTGKIPRPNLAPSSP